MFHLITFVRQDINKHKHDVYIDIDIFIVEAKRAGIK